MKPTHSDEVSSISALEAGGLGKTLALTVGLAMLSLAGPGSAATLYWDGGSSNITANGDGLSQGAAGIWATNIQNWDPGAGLAHVNWDNGQSYDAYFGTSAGVVTLNAAITANTLTVAGTNYLFTDGGISANTLAVNTVYNSANTTISNNIVNYGTLVKDGAGTLTLLQPSPSLAAGININAGTLVLGTATAGLPTGPQGFGNVAIAANAALKINVNASASYYQNISGDGAFQVQGNSVNSQVTLGGYSTFSGNTTIGQVTVVIPYLSDSAPGLSALGYGTNVTIGNSSSAATLSYKGYGDTTSRAITLGGTTASTSLDSSGYGPLVWNGPVSSSGSTPRTLTLTGSSSYINTLAGVISDGSATSTALAKSGGGLWLLTGANTFSGGVKLNLGTLLITNESALGVSTNRVTFTPGVGSTLVGTLCAVSNDVTLGAGHTVTVTNTTNAAIFAVGDIHNFYVGAYLTGTGAVSKASSSYTNGWVRFSNDTNDYTGDFSVGYGNTEFTSVANQGAASSLGKGAAATGGQITLGNGASSGTLRYVGTSKSATTRPLNWTGTTGTYTLDVTNTGTVAYLAAGNLKSGSGSATLNLTGTNPGTNTLKQVINDSGGVTTVTKSGAGKWVLLGANTYSGPTTISGGTLSISSDANLGPNSLSVNGGVLSASTSFTLGANRTIVLGPTSGSGSGTLEVAGGQTLTYGGSLGNNGGTASLVKTGAGTLALSGANSYSGDTIISGGTLALTGSGTLGGGIDLILGAGATLDVSGVSGGYALAPSQQFVLTNNATATVAGHLNANSVAMVIDYTNGVPALNVSNGTFTLDGGITATLSIRNGGVPLPGGSYKLFARVAGGAVGGTVPGAVAFGGDGVATNNAFLSITNSELYLVVPGGAASPGTTVTTLALTSGSSPSLFGSPLTFRATVTGSGSSGTPSGTVTFRNSATVLGSGALSGSGTTATATFTTSGLPAGTDSIVAAYAGDSNYVGSTNAPALTQVVQYNQPVLSGVSLSGNGVVVSFAGTNGAPYRVLTSTNAAAALAGWTSVASGTLTGGVVSYTNSSPTDPLRFYIIASP